MINFILLYAALVNAKMHDPTMCMVNGQFSIDCCAKQDEATTCEDGYEVQWGGICADPDLSWFYCYDPKEEQSPNKMYEEYECNKELIEGWTVTEFNVEE